MNVLDFLIFFYKIDFRSGGTNLKLLN